MKVWKASLAGSAYMIYRMARDESVVYGFVGLLLFIFGCIAYSVAYDKERGETTTIDVIKLYLIYKLVTQFRSIAIFVIALVLTTLQMCGIL